jgi:hypothetical protein
VNASPTSEPTFVLCVESGIYEVMAVRAIASLRTFGGSFADCDVLVMTSRLGPPLARSTRNEFAKLGVRTCFRPRLRHDWFPWMGKVWTAIDGERLAATETVAFVDCDVLFLREPTHLSLPPEAVIAIGYPDHGLVGTAGPGSRYETAWERACAAVGVSVDDLPWVDPGDGSERIRFYVNSGVFVFRKGAGIPEKWLECIELLFKHRADFGAWREHFYDQIALGLAVVRFRLGFAPLPYSHNFGVDSSIPAAWNSPDLREVRLLHYHDQLNPEKWSATVERLEASHPEVAAWLTAKGPQTDPSGPPARVVRDVLQRARLVTRRGYRLRGWVDRKRGRDLLLGGVEGP